MPWTRSALGEDVGAWPCEPPHEHVVAMAALRARTVQTDWPMRRPDSVTLKGSFETARSEVRTRIDPLASHAGKYSDAARRLAQRSRSPSGTNADAAVAGGATETMTAVRVLVVEDDANIGTLLAEMLDGMGYDVCAIEATEADAVSAAARFKPDLMIVDVGLGEGSGVAAIETICRTRPVPHVFVSGDVLRVRPLRPRSIFIQKPYRQSDLARVIQQALDAASIQ